MADLRKELQRIRESANPRVQTNLEEARRLYKEDQERKSQSPVRTKSQEKASKIKAQAKINTGLTAEEKQRGLEA